VHHERGIGVTEPFGTTLIGMPAAMSNEAWVCPQVVEPDPGQRRAGDDAREEPARGLEVPAAFSWQNVQPLGSVALPSSASRCRHCSSS